MLTEEEIRDELARREYKLSSAFKELNTTARGSKFKFLMGLLSTKDIIIIQTLNWILGEGDKP